MKVSRGHPHRSIRRLALGAALLIAVGVHATTNDPWTTPARYTFEYRVDFSKMQNGEAAPLRVWVPYPADTPHQKVLSASIESAWPHVLTEDAMGNHVLSIEGTGVPASDLVMRFDIERRPSDGIPASDIKPKSPLDPQRYLQSARLIPLGGVIEQLAEQQSRNATTDAEKARAFYDYVVTTMRYNKDGTGWGRGDALWACDNKRGNCTDFHSLFIGMARSQHIPARFIIGFPVPRDTDGGRIGGYHCWAEYYEQDRGWVPLDSSEATKSGNRDAYFGILPNDRIEFTVGRDLVLAPAQKGAPLNFFIYPYAEVDGKAVPPGELETMFRFRRAQTGPARGAHSPEADVADDRRQTPGDPSGH
jgi:transglutaminase-like putative cysteine protease